MLFLMESFWNRWEKETLLGATKQTKLSKTSLPETVRPEMTTSALVPILQQHSLLRKTNKAQLFKELEKNVPVLERHLTNVSNIYDGMANL